MPTPFISIVTVATPFVLRYLQSASAKDKATATALEQRIKVTQEVLIRVSTHTSGLTYYFEQAMWASVLDRGGNEDLITEDKKNWQAYSELLAKWKANRIADYTCIHRYFGPVAAQQFHEIAMYFNTLERQIAAAQYERTDSRHFIENDRGGDNDFRTKFLDVYAVASKKVVSLNQEMFNRLHSLISSER